MNVGDRVRCIKPAGWIEVGDEGTLSYQDESPNRPYFVTWDSGRTYWHSRYEIEVIA